MQTGMFFHYLKDPDSLSYQQQIAWRIRGCFDTAAFYAAWNDLVAHHDILRTNFIYRHSRVPLQVVAETRELAPDIIDLSDTPERIKQIKEQERHTPFDLENGPLLRLKVLKLNIEEYEIILTHHHIIMDGWSLGNLVKDSLSRYSAHLSQQTPPVHRARPYRDYIDWLKQQDSHASTEFWRAYLDGYDTPATPVQSPQPALDDRQKALYFDINRDDLAELNRLATGHNVTLNTLFQALWGVLLCQYNNSDDVVFATVVSGRPQDLPGVEDMAGIFINTIPVRLRIDGDMTLADLLQQVQQNTLHSADHHHSALSDIQTHTPLKDRLFGSLYVMENYPLDDVFELNQPLPGTGFCVTALETWEKTHFDFGLRLLPDQGAMNIKIGYNPALYDDRHMAQIRTHLHKLVQHLITQGSATKLAEIELVSPPSKATTPSPNNKDTLVNLFKKQVACTPQASCLVCCDQDLSYQDVDRLSDRVAARLQTALAPEADDRVALLLERGPWAVIAILGVLKAGAAYVPIDADTPGKRMQHILDDSAAKALLAGPATLATAQRLDVPCIIDITDNTKTEPYRPVDIKPDNLAYVIYTSGTTGTPKGVMIEHGSVVHLINAMHSDVYGRHNGRLNMVLLTTYVFDGSVQQIFSALLGGHRLFIMDDTSKRDPQRFVRFCLTHKIDVAGCIPNFLSLLHDSGELDKLIPQLRHMIFGGEPLPARLANHILNAPNAPVVSNLYGPTECCVNALSFTTEQPVADHHAHVPLGTALGAGELLILNRWGQPCVPGSVGELCLAGPGVARGYLNQPDLSAQKFIPHPQNPGERLYKTGDLVRLNTEGNVEFLGRNDQQVKIMGYRIEPDEVAQKLLHHPDIQDAAVVCGVADNEQGYLKACFVPTKPDILSSDDVRIYLGDHLPAHMVPTRYSQLTDMPRLVSGKIDRKTLLNSADMPVDAQNTQSATPARTRQEEILLDAFQQVFGRDDIGIEHDYFQLGGDSIRAIQILSQLFKLGMRMELKDLFDHPRICDLAPYLVHDDRVEEEPAINGDVPLTPIQKRFFATFSTNPNWFNHAVLLNAHERLNKTALQKALTALNSHHDIFRLRYQQDTDGNWTQYALDEAPPLSLQVIQLDKKGPEKRQIERHANQAHTALNLQNGPLACVLLFQGETQDRLLLVLHHLIIDGVSWRILLEDLVHAYEAARNKEAIKIARKTHNLQTWGKALQDYAHSNALYQERPYWQDLHHKEVCPFPVEIPAPHNRLCDTLNNEITMDEAATQILLGEINNAFNTTTEEILLIALSRTLHSWRKIKKSIVMLEGHGRSPVLNQCDVSRTLGWFTSLYPVLLDMTPDADIADQIKRIKETLRAIPNKGFGYGVLKYLSPDGLGDTRAFEDRCHMTFNYLGQFDAPTHTGLFDVTTDHTGTGVAPSARRTTDLDISAMVMDRQMTISLTYSKHRFLQSTMEDLLHLYVRELHMLIDFCTHQRTSELTPADLTLSGLSLDEFESLF